MRRRSLALAAALTCICLGAPVIAAPGAQSTPDALLTAPVTPGSLIQMVQFAGSPDVDRRIRTSIADPRPELRAAAARAVWAARLTEHVPAVREALANERAHAAALEQMRVLLAFDKTSSEPVIIAAWKALGPESTRTTALLYAQAHGPAALDAVPRLFDLGLTRHALAVFALAATGYDALRLDAAAGAALTRADWVTFKTLLDAAELIGTRISHAVLVASLEHDASSKPRLLAMWHLLGGTGDVAELRPAIEQALVREALATDADAELVVELIARRLGRPARDDADWREILLAPHPHAAAALEWPAGDIGSAWVARRGTFPLLSPQERSTLNVNLLRVAQGTVTPDAIAPYTVTSGTPASYPPGVVADVLRSAGCKPPRNANARLSLTLTLDAEGRVASASPAHVDAPPACVKAADTLMAAYADHFASRQPGIAIRVVLPLNRQFVECLDTMNVDPVQIASRLTPVRAEQQEVRRSGHAFLSVVVSPKGCVQSLTVIRSEDERVEWDAVRDISRWRFDPPVLNGRSVAVRGSVAYALRAVDY